MKLFDKLLNRKTMPATIAKERLQIILAHERIALDSSAKPNWIMLLQDELLTVIAKYIKIEKDDLKVNFEKRDNLDLLEINITLPDNQNKE